MKTRVTTSHHKFKTTMGAARFIVRMQDRNRGALASGVIRGMEFSTAWDMNTRLYTVKVRTDRTGV